MHDRLFRHFPPHGEMKKDFKIAPKTMQKKHFLKVAISHAFPSIVLFSGRHLIIHFMIRVKKSNMVA